MTITQYRENLNSHEDIYRAKLKTDNLPHKKGDWVFGNLVKMVDGDTVSTYIYYYGEVFAKTVGRCVGLPDCDGEIAFDGDIISDMDGYEVGIVRWDDDSARFVLDIDNVIETAESIYAYRIIGNVHDNPELLERDAPDIDADAAPIQTVYIPSCDNHGGIHGIHVRLRWICPKCGKPRGKPVGGLSYDGSQYLSVHKWTNPCGHVDKYADVRHEAVANGLNIVTEVIPSDHGEGGDV